MKSTYILYKQILKLPYKTEKVGNHRSLKVFNQCNQRLKVETNTDLLNAIHLQKKPKRKK
jgi:hypothetical protein